MPNVQAILNMKGSHVFSIPEDQTVLTAAHTMNQHRVGALVVTRAEKVIGIFTERDVLCRVVATGCDPAQTLVKDVMSTPVACCTPDTTHDECRAAMRNRRIRHLPVVHEGRLVGIVSIGDVLAALEAVQGQTIRYLYEYMYGAWDT